MSEEGISYSSSEKRKPSPPPVRVERIETEGTMETVGTETTTAEPPPSSPLKLNPRSRAQTTGSIDLDDYFVGPRDLNKHSKWPMFMRMHGSILPKMILPLTIVGGWATLFTCISELVKPLGVDSILLTILGFVVGLALSFRSSSAYERYAEGRKYWAQLMLTSHNLARVIWVHAEEREGEEGKRDLLAKLSGLNLIVAFAVALKHKLRFEPLTSYEDLSGLVDYLDTFAKEAEDEALHHPKKTPWKATGEYLGVSFAESNPRKLLKKSKKPLGNLPLEILTYLSAYVDSIMQNDTLRLPIYQTHAVNSVQSFDEILTGCERVLSTPLPIAYSIAISQITYTYVLLLPFQLYTALGWVTIPGTIAAAYIILGIALIGREIENPFGNDVNDLPLDRYCEQVAADIDVISSMQRPTKNVSAWLRRDDNLPLWPLSMSGFKAWEYRSESQIMEALKLKANLGTTGRKSSQVSRQNGEV